MAKKRKELVSDIKKLHETMTTMLIKAKVSPTRMLRPVDKMEKKDYNDVRKLRTWLQRIYDGPYMKCRKVYDELSPETWKRYEEFGIYDMAEQDALRKVLGELDEAWGNKPKIKKRKNVQRHSRAKTN